MKIDLNQWAEVKPNEENDAPKGRLRLRISKAAPVYVTSKATGAQVLVGVGTEIDVQTKEELTFLVESSASTRVFLENPVREAYPARDERFTNDSKRPIESPMVTEVKRALRELKIQQAAYKREAAQAAHLLKQPLPTPEAAPEPEPVPASELEA